MELILLISILKYIDYFVANIYHLLQIIQCHLLIINYTLLLCLIGHTLTMLGTIGFIMFYVLNINLWMVNIVIRLKHRNSFGFTHKLIWYRTIFLKSLQHTLQFNQYYSQLFMVFLVINLPFNLIVFFKLFTQIEHIIRVCLVLLFAEQTFGILCIHFVFANFNSKYNNNKIMMFQLAANQKKLQFKSNLTLNLFAQTFICKKNYGLTYGKFGLISMFKFFKVCHNLKKTEFPLKFIFSVSISICRTIDVYCEDSINPVDG